MVHFCLQLSRLLSTSTPIISALAFVSIMMTIIVLRGLSVGTSTENLLISIAIADLVLPLVQLIWSSIAFQKTGNDAYALRAWLTYSWSTFYLVSVLLTLVLAIRRYIALQHPQALRTLRNRQNTKRIIFAVYIFCAILVWATVFYKPEQVFDASTNKTTSVSYGNYISKITPTIGMFFFNILSPMILGMLVVKFVLALRERISPSVAEDRLAHSRQKTMLVIFMSLIRIASDLPLGILFIYLNVFGSPLNCSTKLGQLAKVLTIALSGLKFVVLCFTSENFWRVLTRTRVFRNSAPDRIQLQAMNLLPTQ